MEPLYRVHSIVMEASSKEDKEYMTKMSKDDIHQINGTLVQNLYESVLKKKNVDFGDIPDSNGDIRKVKYYDSTVECLDALEALYYKNNIDDDSVSVIRRAISNMKRFRPQFMTGFQVKHEFIMVTYNTLVMAIIDATSMIIASYMEFIVSPDTKYNPTSQTQKNRGSVALSSLRSFNDACQNGKFGDAMNYMVEENKKAFVGDTVLITGAVIVCLLSIIPITRELIFFYYHTRVRLSDYLMMQSSFLEMNRLAVESSGKSPSEKKAIVKKQSDIIKKMRKLADKISIDDVDMNDVAKKEQKEENALWTLGNIEKQLSKNKLDGKSFTVF